MKTQKSFISLFIVVFLATSASCNIYEFVIGGGQRNCLSDFFKADSQPSLDFKAFKLTKQYRKSEELDDLTQAGVIKKRKGTAEIDLKIKGASGILYSTVKKSGQIRTFKTKLDEEVSFCFKNYETGSAFIIFDLKTGAYSGDMSNIPSGENSQNMIDRLEDIRVRMDNSLSLYKQMEVYEEKHLSASTGVLSGVLFVSQLMIAFVALVGWGITLVLEKSLKRKKVL